MAASSTPTWVGPDELGTLIAQSASGETGAGIDDPRRRDLVTWAIALVTDADLLPSQQVTALASLGRACDRLAAIERLHLTRPVVHGELLLHWATRVLPHLPDADARTRELIDRIERPDAAVVITADPEEIVRRVQAQDRVPDAYRTVDPDRLPGLVTAAHRVAEVAATALAARGLPVLRLDTTADPDAAEQLRTFLETPVPAPPQEDLRDRLIDASSSFRKKDGRHELRTKHVLYCAFSTPRFTIRPEEAGRDATKRVAALGLTREQVVGRSVLDLGSNTGAMLFELSNFDPASGYGIEYDAEKVDLANEIAELAQIPNVRFEQGDIDLLEADQVGVHDIVLALAIEAHLRRPKRLYHLLGQVTGDLLCFEGNSGCDLDAVRRRLTAAGFGDFTDLGFCQDDRDPRNNRRPQLLARKLPAGAQARHRSTAYGSGAIGRLSRLRPGHRGA